MDWKSAETLAERIKIRRKELGLTQEQLASLAGVSSSHVSFLETGQRGENLGLAMMFKLKEALRVPLYFFDVSGLHMGNPSRERDEVHA